MSTLSTPGDPPAAAPAPADDPEPAGRRVGGPKRGRHERTLVIVTMVVILGASAAFLRAQTLKLEPSPLKRPRVERFFSPRCDCEDKSTATLAFSLREPSRLDAQVIDEQGRVVRTLLEGAELPRGRRRLAWDGRDDAGRAARDGQYRLRLVLNGGREVVVPTPFTLDTEPPRAQLISVAPRAIAAGEPDAPRSSSRRRARPPAAASVTEVRYRASEAARATLLVDGRIARRSGRRPPGVASLEWRGRAGGRELRPGAYELSVRLRDRAGNLSAPSRGVPVRVVGSRKR